VRVHDLRRPPCLELMAGVHYDKTPAPAQTVTLDQPTFSHWGLHTGVRYPVGRFKLAASYLHYWYDIPRSGTASPTRRRTSAAAARNNIMTVSVEAALGRIDPVTRATIPAHGRGADALLADLEARKAKDTDWKRGRVFSLVYHAGDEHAALLERAHALYASGNLLNPMAFQSLRGLEAEITQMAADLMHGGPDTVGAVTSGGTESILVAVAAYRDRARQHKPWIRRPRSSCADHGAPRLRQGRALLRRPAAQGRGRRRSAGRRARARAGDRGVDDRGGSVGAAVRPRRDRSDQPRSARCARGPSCRCTSTPASAASSAVGRAAGPPLPPWDFRVPAVTSISADLHKYAYAGKGASVLLWRSMADMQHQFFVAADFPGGIYVSPTLIGTRPGGPIAAAWAALRASAPTATSA
jgi:sphinganine-1-phosphate aldolase